MFLQSRITDFRLLSIDWWNISLIRAHHWHAHAQTVDIQCHLWYNPIRSCLSRTTSHRTGNVMVYIQLASMARYTTLPCIVTSYLPSWSSHNVAEIISSVKMSLACRKHTSSTDSWWRNMSQLPDLRPSMAPQIKPGKTVSSFRFSGWGDTNTFLKETFAVS